MNVVQGELGGSKGQSGIMRYGWSDDIAAVLDERPCYTLMVEMVVVLFLQVFGWTCCWSIAQCQFEMATRTIVSQVAYSFNPSVYSPMVLHWDLVCSWWSKKKRASWKEHHAFIVPEFDSSNDRLQQSPLSQTVMTVARNRHRRW